MIVWCLILSDVNEDNAVRDFDIFGLYSTEEKVEEAKKWIKREDGRYNGVPGHIYNRAIIVSRVIDYNLPNFEGNETEGMENRRLEQLQLAKSKYGG